MSVRHHVAVLGAVMLALAAGLVAGAGGGPALLPTGDPRAGASATDVPPGGAAAATGDAAAAAGGGPGDVTVGADEVLAGSLPAVVAGTLAGRNVGVLVVAGAPPATVEAVSGDVTAAGARVAVRATLGEGWADDAATALRDGLARQLGAPGAPGAPGASDDEALVGLLGDALAGVAEEPAPGATRSTVWGVLTGAGLVSGALDARARPDVLVVVAPAVVPADSVAGWVAVLDGLSGVLPLVVAAPGDAGRTADGVSLVPAVRESPAGARMSTVDHAGTGLGRVAVVRAAAGLPEGVRGHYGSLRGATTGAPDGG